MADNSAWINEFIKNNNLGPEAAAKLQVLHQQQQMGRLAQAATLQDQGASAGKGVNYGGPGGLPESDPTLRPRWNGPTPGDSNIPTRAFEPGSPFNKGPFDYGESTLMQAQGNGSPMQNAIMSGQVTPDELMPRMANIPEYGLSANSFADSNALMGQAGQQLAIGAGEGGGGLANLPVKGAIGPGEQAAVGAGESPLALGAGEAAAPKAGAMADALGLGAGESAPLVEHAITSAIAGEATVPAAVQSGLMASLASKFPALAGNISMKAVGTGAGAAMAGLAAGGWLDSKNIGGENSAWDRLLPNMLRGGGVAGGAALALGAAAGPVGWAVLGGAALYGIGEMAFGDHLTTVQHMNNSVDKLNTTVNHLLTNPQFNVDPQTASQVRLQIASTTQFLIDQKDKAGLESYIKSLSSTMPSFLMEANSRYQGQQEKLKLQASFGPVYSGMVDRSANAAKTALDSQMQAAAQVSDPKMKADLQAQAANSYRTHIDTQTAYTQQIAMGTQQMPQAAQAQSDAVTQLMQQYMQPAK